MKTKPDNVVFNPTTQKYDAALKPYATSVGAPIIKTVDTVAWKNKSISKANHHIQAKYLELKQAYDEMMDEYNYNNTIYNAKFSFEPIVGDVYHLYQKENDSNFLSLIAPEQCNFNYLGSFYLNTELIWEKYEDYG
ncbi:DUF2452 domain-containing protein [Cellulophaga sp. HaHaR_3_176]|uniref:DUF2452 domain-containing protein n=1 Tax=Cellulophaga sp. HaHaR_3_176 TaxID=1942464 RepID=UPI00352F8661